MRARAFFAGAVLVVLSLVLSPIALAQDPPPSEGTDAAAPNTTTAATTTTSATTTTTPAVTTTEEQTVAAAETNPQGQDRSSSAAGRAKAGDPGVTISDFKFNPKGVTISVGDTITWTNQGPSQHTATANNGEFDTGILNDGESASHTFSNSGTFNYICTLHPFMKGTVTVLARSGGAGGGGSGGSSGDASGTSGETSSGETVPTTGTGSESTAVDSPAAAGSSSQLPMTGQPELPLIVVGAALLAGGALVRRRAGARS